MPTSEDRRHQGFGPLGVAAVACLACCAGPILAFLGGLSLAGLAASLFIGAAGLLVAAVAAGAYVVVRRRACEAPAEVGVGAPGRKR